MEAVVLAVELQYVCYACSEVRGARTAPRSFNNLVCALYIEQDRH
jgi:hypothetical protein